MSSSFLYTDKEKPFFGRFQLQIEKCHFILKTLYYQPIDYYVEANVGTLLTEDRRQNTEDRIQKAEYRRQNTEDRRQKAEAGK